MQEVEESPKYLPIKFSLKVGDEIKIADTHFKDIVARIISLTGSGRIGVLLNFFGGSRLT